MHATSSIDTNFRGKCPLSEPPIRELSGLSAVPGNVWHAQNGMPVVINLDKGSSVGVLGETGERESLEGGGALSDAAWV